MAIVTPTWLQNGTYTAKMDRIFSTVLFTEGVMRPGTGQLAVSPTSPASMNVQIAAGYACITGDDSANQGNYLVHVDATETVTIPAAPGSLSRIDSVVLRINDPAEGGPAGDDATIVVVSGAVSGTPSPPALPSSAIRLANITVAAGITSITAGLIADARTQAQTILANTLTNAGDLLSFDGANTIRVPVGATGRPLVAGSGAVAYSQLTDTGLATGAVTEAKIGALAVTEGKIASSAVSVNKLATNAVSTVKIQNNAVDHMKRKRGDRLIRTNNSDQTINSAVTAKVKFQTNVEDSFTGGVTVSANEEFTLPATYDGDYSVLVRLTFQGNDPSDGLGSYVRINNGVRDYSFVIPGLLANMTFCPVVDIAAGNAFYVEVQNISGAQIRITQARLEVRQLS